LLNFVLGLNIYAHATSPIGVVNGAILLIL
jgi:hypothetical protein